MSDPVGPSSVTGVPVGFGIEFDRTLQRPDVDLLVGGTPLRLLRLSGPGRDALRELESGRVSSAAGGVLARRLTDAGLAHPRPPENADADADLVVIVPAHGRPELLDRCLTALGRHFPVVVVDDASSDAAAVAEVAVRHGARLIRRDDNGGPGAARNTGLATVAAEFVAFVDSDAAPRPEALTALAAHLADPAGAAVAPRIRAARTTARTTRYAVGRSALDLGARPARVAPRGRVTYVPSTVLVARRAALGDGFDERLRVGEDVDLIWRLNDAGHRIRYDPEVEVAHTEPSTWSGLLARRYRYGSSAAHLTRCHPGRLTPLVVEPWTAGLVVALLARRPRLATLAFLGGVVEECLRRRRLGLPVRPCAGVVARRAWTAWRNSGGWAVRFLSPALLVGARRGRASTVAALVLAEPLESWWTARTRAADPVTHVLGHLAEDVAYGAGVIDGCIRECTVEPLLPKVRRV